MFSFVRHVCTVLIATLSIILKDGLKPLIVKYSMLFLNVSTIVDFFVPITGIVGMVLVIQSYSMKRIVLPWIKESGICL